MSALLQVSDLSVHFPVGRTLMGRPRARVHAVDHVSLDVRAHETLGLVGESGSGKSTLGRAVLRLLPLAGGSVSFGGTDITAGMPRQMRRRVHMVFQDPYSSLDPSWTVRDLVAEPLSIQGGVTRDEQDERVLSSLEHVGLGVTHLQRYAHEFSGGQRQRIAIARALVSRPEMIVCDEAVSALDVSTQSQVINILRDLQDEFGLSYLFIAHDLAVVKHLSHRIAVMYLGAVVEVGPAEGVYQSPGHPYTASLLSAIPVANPKRRGQSSRIVLTGEPPSPLNPPSGCRFRTRCPFAMDICRELAPELVPLQSGGEAACHLHTSGPKLEGASVLELTTPESYQKPFVVDPSLST